MQFFYFSRVISVFTIMSMATVTGIVMTTTTITIIMRNTGMDIVTMVMVTPIHPQGITAIHTTRLLISMHMVLIM
ncbi:hypothetical protein OESDEN_25342 [Oesophagostomum dentatum]|uniref:Uncharacterized protein n=1 Tax=Oesophagostomum dentatum TaxID=61180 RepID=A0A0B1RV69_OESDE|nr:hypothetical protein OESDEN_25342 [Oesophagostomum dentatum]